MRAFVVLGFVFPYHDWLRKLLRSDVVFCVEWDIQELISRLDSARKLPEFTEITQNNGHYAVQGHSRSPILIPIESSYTISC